MKLHTNQVATLTFRHAAASAGSITTKLFSKDGAASASLSGAISAVTGMSGIYQITLTAAEVGDIGELRLLFSDGSNVTDLALSVEASHPGFNNSVSSATSLEKFIGTSGSSVDDFYRNAFIVFVDGALAGEVRRVLAYTGSTKEFYTESFTVTPTVGDKFFVLTS
jgi:hypothetical protein